MSMPFKISDLFIYPIKSMAGISVDSATALTEGFEYDRRMMLVDETGKFMSQREHAKMALFQTEIIDGHISVRFDNGSINIPIGEMYELTTSVSVWGSKLKAYEMNAIFSEWFSDHLNQKVKLVTMGEKSKRYKRLFESPFSTYVSLADGYPYLLLGKASLNELNTRCPEEIPMDRFRANIIVESQNPHEEDDLGSLELGQAKFKNIKPCARCVVITIDQKNAIKSKEPLATLSQYRKVRNKINFGTNLICLEEGIVKVGDELRC